MSHSTSAHVRCGWCVAERQLKTMGQLSDKIGIELETVAARHVTPTGTREHSNIAPALAEIYFWQEAQNHAEEMEKLAWKKAADLLGTDADMRDLGEGEHIIGKSKGMCAIAKINKPRRTLDVDMLLRNIAKRFKLDIAKLRAEEDRARVEGTPPLSKKVLET